MLLLTKRYRCATCSRVWKGTDRELLLQLPAYMAEEIQQYCVDLRCVCWRTMTDLCPTPCQMFLPESLG